MHKASLNHSSRKVGSKLLINVAIILSVGGTQSSHVVYARCSHAESYATWYAGSDTDNDDYQARALKRPRLVWTLQLHQRFVDAVEQLGLKNAVPKTIMQVCSFASFCIFAWSYWTLMPYSYRSSSEWSCLNALLTHDMTSCLLSALQGIGYQRSMHFQAVIACWSKTVFTKQCKGRLWQECHSTFNEDKKIKKQTLQNGALHGG